MTGKASAVFWIALLLIVLNFWVSGQSSVVWNSLTGKTGAKPQSTPPKQQHLPFGGSGPPTTHGHI